MAAKKIRLDLALVERGLAPTRAKAQALVMARRVRVNGEYEDKSGKNVTEEDRVEVEEPEHPWVGRGGMKLAAAVEKFGIVVSGKPCADIGASTGGFTDVLLQHGATKVWAIDVGYGQLDQRLRDDPRVVVREKVNARYLEPDHFDEPPRLVTIDVSFISLKLILPAVAKILATPGEVLALIKPQFEVGKGEVGRGGIVRDEPARAAVIEGILTFTRALGFEIAGTMDSPVRGAEGNLEALMWAKR